MRMSVTPAHDLRGVEGFLNNTFGVTGKPLMRPPYGGSSDLSVGS
jgi:hypothetical protein